MPSPLVIRNTQCPGDIVVLSAAVRDLARRHPGKFEVTMAVSPGSEYIYANNPYIKKAQQAKKPTTSTPQYVAQYPLIHQSNQAHKHFLWGFIEHMNGKLKTDVKLTEFRPDMHLSPEEKLNPIIEPPYWVFLSGGKTDFRTKIWARRNWEQVISATKKEIHWVQCGGGSKNHIMHEKIDGVQSYLVKKTGLREFIRLIYHADGVVCPVTAAMHIAAAFNKPCVVIAGGREPWWWEAYNNENRLFNMRLSDPTWQLPASDTYVEHKFLHTLGQLSCCKGKGCWKSKLTGKNAKCQEIVKIGKQELPKCLAMITPEMVIESMFSYYKAGQVDKRLNVATSAVVPKHSFCLYGERDSWYHATAKMLTDEDAERPILNAKGDLVEAIKKAALDTTGHLFWLQHGCKPMTEHQIKMLTSVLSPSTVFGRIYRDRTGKLYPHPAMFAVPAKMVNQNARSYPALFAKIHEDHFLPIGSDIQLPMERPCNDDS